MNACFASDDWCDSCYRPGSPAPEFALTFMPEQPLHCDSALATGNVVWHGSVLARSSRIRFVFSHLCRGSVATLPSVPAVRPRCFPRPAHCRPIGGLHAPARPGSGCYHEWRASCHWRPGRLASCLCTAGQPISLSLADWTPRRSPSVQESTSLHEKRNVDQCLAAGGMPDRDC